MPHTVSRGGLLLEIYLHGFACDTLHRKFTRLLKVTKNTGRDSIPDDDVDGILEEYGSKIAGCLVFNLNSISTAGRYQLFYVTFIAKFYGLSRMGIIILSKYGLVSSMTYFDNKRKERIREAQLQTT